MGKKKGKKKGLVTRPWSEMRAELREIHGPEFDRQVRLEGVWFDTSQEIARRPKPPGPVDPTLRGASIANQIEAISDAFDHPTALRVTLVQLAADVVEWIEQIDADLEDEA